MSDSTHHTRPSVLEDLSGSVKPGRNTSRQDVAGSVAGSGVLTLLAAAVAAYAVWRRLR